jgi:hypothetical protein
MLASTIQFSKYGQENQPHIHHLPIQAPEPGKQHTRSKHPHQRFGESRPQPPDTHRSAKIQCIRDPEEKAPNPQKPEFLLAWARFLRTQQRASMIHSATSTFHALSRRAVLVSATPLHI